MAEIRQGKSEKGDQEKENGKEIFSLKNYSP